MEIVLVGVIKGVIVDFFTGETVGRGAGGVTLLLLLYALIIAEFSSFVGLCGDAEFS